MRRQYLLLVTIVFLLAALGCATVPKPTTFSNSQVYQDDFDAVWTAVIEAFADNSWSIDNIEKASGLITTDWMRATNRSPVLADCGKDIVGEPSEGVLGEILLRFNVFVKSTAAGHAMRVTCTFKTVKDDSGCLSKGVVEARLMDTVSAILHSE
ncbi:MAG: outer membrane protein assembly factor BamC [Candidatus Eisenbacteria sp.]|nr:outer membrane protein assembly factor BamC [Candidatus Eisenbacteria bacterium]